MFCISKLDTLLSKMPTPEAILLSGVLASSVALYAVFSSRKVSRRNASINLMTESHRNISLTAGMRGIKSSLRADSGCDIKNAVEKFVNDGSLDDKDAETLNHYMYVFNFYEHVAVGVKNKAYDNRILKDNRYTTVTRLWGKTEVFRAAIREKNSTAYQEFEWLVQKWEHTPLTPNRVSVTINIPKPLANIINFFK